MEDAGPGGDRIRRDELTWDSSQRLRDAITDAQILVEYSARAGIAVDSDTVETLISAQTRRDESSDAGFAVEFWNAFRQICHDIKPVTLASIKTSLLEADQNFAKRTIRRYTFWTMALLVVVLVVQVYWVVGRALADRTSDLIEEGEKVSADILLANRDWNQMTALFKAREDEARSIAARESVDSDGSANGRIYEYQFYTSGDFEQAIAPIEHNQMALQTDLENTRTELDRNAKLLDNWSGVWGWLFLRGIATPDVTDSRKELEQRIEETTSSIAQLDRTLSDTAADITAEAAAEREEERSNLVVLKEELTLQLQQDQRDVDSRIVRLSSEFVLITLNSYLLPLLYGLLGASVYVLRALKREVSNVTFTKDTGQGYFLRLSLGMLAGLFIGWFAFLIPGQSVLNSLSPLALAFLVGYNVEIIFSLMDKLIGVVKRYEIDDEGAEQRARAQPNVSTTK